jgi:hypothetical protein
MLPSRTTAIIFMLTGAYHPPKPKIKIGGWSKRPSNYIKVNFDACFDADFLKGTT